MSQEAPGEPTPVVAPQFILLVEDEVFPRMAIADDLMNAGFQVIQAATADEAWKLLRSSIKVDLVLTDINMPGTLNGCDLATLIHAIRPTIKIVILSGQYNGALATTPADAFVPKPYFLPLLIGTIRRLLGISSVNPARPDGHGGWRS